MRNAECSTGVEYLDNLLGGLRIGDNLVWETDAGTYVDLFAERFAHHSLAAGQSLIYVSFNRSPMTIVKKLSRLPNQENITLLDCFTSGKGGNDSTFVRFYEPGGHTGEINVIKVDNPSDVSQFTAALNDLEEEKGAGTRYIFDSLTGMQDLWGDEARTYRFFTYSCPRLYDLDTIAYWILEKEAHTSNFKANLEHVTQVTIEVSHTAGQLFLKVTKSENRYSPGMFKPQTFEVWNDEIVFREAAESDFIDLGGKVKALRLKRGLTQSDLAEKMGVTASYISQLERNLISPSIDSLMKISSKLQVLPGYFLSLDSSIQGEMIYRKSQRHPILLSGVKGGAVECLSLVASTENPRMQPIMVIIEPNSTFPGHFLDHKGDEFILILNGELELDIDGQIHLLREGDSVYLDSVIPATWRNVGEITANAIWVLSPPGI